MEKRIVILLAVAMSAICTQADTWTDSGTGYTWTYTVSGESAEITGISPKPTGALTIPSQANGKKVTSIGDGAFAGCSELTSVTIPDGVTEIGDWAFEFCSGLTSVTIPDGVTNIRGGAFDGSESLYDTTTIPGVILVDGWVIGHMESLSGDLDLTGARGIADDAFSACDRLTSVLIPDSVTGIGMYVFNCCSSLTSFSVGAGNPNYSSINGLLLSKNGETLIYGVKGDVVIPDCVTSIAEGAFYGSPLKNVSIPRSVTNIGTNAFHNTGFVVHVMEGDTERIKALIIGSGYNVNNVTFVEDFVPSSSTSTPVAFGYAVIEAKDIIAPYAAQKAVTLTGAVYDGSTVAGIVELKLGKVNATKGTGRVSGSVTTLDGKRHTIQAFNLTGIDGATPKAVSLEVRDLGTMSVTIGGTQFAGSMGRYHVQSAAVGGNWDKGGTKVYVDAPSASLPAGTLEDLLPNGEPVTASNGKWKFAKAASVKWAKPKAGAAQPERYDAESGKGLLVDTSADKTNLSAMRLTYTPKKGTFKGSFKVYALEGSGKATKLKKYTVKVSGVVVGGVGYGTATCKNPAMSWSVTVK